MSEQQGIVLTPRLLWAMLSAAAIVAGSLGPWITIGALSAGGTNDGGDGVFTLVLGILAFALVIAERSRPAVAAVAGAALAIGVIDASTVLRTDGNELFSVNLGWGLIVLNLGAASLLVWGVLEAVQGKTSSRRGIALIAMTVAVVVTAGILAVSGRFDDPNDTDEPVAQLGGDDAEATKKQPAPPSGPGTEPCDKVGINATRRREGDCVAENGWKVQVVNRSSTARLDDVAVSLVDIRTRESIRDLVDDEIRPEGVFVETTLRVANRTRQPLSLDDSLFALTAAGTTNTPTSALVVRDDQFGSSGDLGPGLSRTGTVLFDVAQSTADALTADGNIVMVQPSDDGGLRDPAKRVAFIRTYGTGSVRGQRNSQEKAAHPNNPEESAPQRSAPSDSESCGNLTVTGDSITCGFANNVFYEYWIASDGGSNQVTNISAYSDALSEWLDLTCDAAGRSVSCATDTGDEVSIPRDGLDEYTQSNADAYAASNTVSE